MLLGLFCGTYCDGFPLKRILSRVINTLLREAQSCGNLHSWGSYTPGDPTLLGILHFAATGCALLGPRLGVGLVLLEFYLPAAVPTNPFDPSAPNCQDWLQSYVRKLVEEGLIAGSAISVVQNAPKLL